MDLEVTKVIKRDINLSESKEVMLNLGESWRGVGANKIKCIVWNSQRSCKIYFLKSCIATGISKALFSHVLESRAKAKVDSSILLVLYIFLML